MKRSTLADVVAIGPRPLINIDVVLRPLNHVTTTTHHHGTFPFDFTCLSADYMCTKEVIERHDDTNANAVTNPIAANANAAAANANTVLTNAPVVLTNTNAAPANMYVVFFLFFSFFFFFQCALTQIGSAALLLPHQHRHGPGGHRIGR
jgi:hypothetical protein